MRDLYTCTQCGGGGCQWCRHTGYMTEDHLRECAEETRKADDDRRSWRRDNERSGAHFGS